MILFQLYWLMGCTACAESFLLLLAAEFFTSLKTLMCPFLDLTLLNCTYSLKMNNFELFFSLRTSCKSVKY